MQVKKVKNVCPYLRFNFGVKEGRRSGNSFRRIDRNSL